MTASSLQAVDARAFDDFYRERWPDAVRLGYVILGDAGAAQDVAQEALAKVQTRFATLRQPWPYTRTVIVNDCRSDFRRRRRELARLQLLSASLSEAVEMEASELLDAIDRLPFRQKAVIVLRYYEDLSEEDIATAIGCRPGTVKSLAARALARLAEEVRR